MPYETVYDGGHKPFVPDQQRGSWASPHDFLYVCMGFAFKMDLLGITYYYLSRMGFTGIFAYLITAAVIIVPIFVILMYLGQFSSTGFITALRISPFFKGIGYMCLLMNLVLLTYYSIFATIPMLFLFNSFQLTLPWSCEGAQAWVDLTKVNFGKFCNASLFDTGDTNATLFEGPDFERNVSHIPSLAYFSSYFKNSTFNTYSPRNHSMSMALMVCSLVIWSVIALIYALCPQVEKLGRLLRYLFWVVIALLLTCIIRFSLLPGAHRALLNYFSISRPRIVSSSHGVAVTAFQTFGVGWGMLVTLASHNRFKTNIMRYSWIVCLGQLAIGMGFAIVMEFIEYHLLYVADFGYISFVANHFILLLSAGTAIANMEWANLWCILYFLMLILATLFVMLTQLMTILTSAYDEFEVLRKYRSEFRMGLIAVLGLCSLHFCSNNSLAFFSQLFTECFFRQVAMSLLIVLIVLWIYGRKRFQSDIEFMQGTLFATWKVYSLSFISPIVLLLCLGAILFLRITQRDTGLSLIDFFGYCIFYLPWVVIPGYGILRMSKLTGPLCARLKSCCRPEDWHPVQADDRVRYEQVLDDVDVVQPLSDVPNDVN